MVLLEDLFFYRGVQRILGPIDLQVARRETVVLCGPSGAGKSSLLSLIAGFAAPAQGRIVLDGRTVSAPGNIVAPHRRRIGMVFQDLALWPHMTVEQHLDYVLRQVVASPTERRERLAGTLATVRLLDRRRRYPAELSGGERQRLALARALAPHPPLLLLDEPFNSLDPVLRGAIIDDVRRCVAELAATVLMVSHDQSDAQALGGRIVRLAFGRIATDGEGLPEAAPHPATEIRENADVAG